jgi:SNF2 family DNA or RNA helicase
MPIRANPYRHQKEAFANALGTFSTEKSEGYALLMEMGTGKSLTAIAIAGRLYLDGKIGRVLVVAPLSIVGVWQEEFEKFADFD